MDYELIQIDEENEAILISANGVQLWIDYFIGMEEGEKFYNWEFNQYIFFDYSIQDQKIKKTQEKILKDVENFDCFLDEIFAEKNLIK